MFDNRVYIIAEAGVNHNGRLDLALQLCDAAKTAGVDAVKFQTWKTENIVTHHTDQAQYQSQNTNKRESQFDMLKNLELSYDDFREIKIYCDKIGIQFLSTPDDHESLDFLVSLYIPFIKIGSAEITNIPYLRYIGQQKMPVVISTGMSYMEDVVRAYNTLSLAGAPQIAVLHCTTNYPCPYNEVNLLSMLSIKEQLGCVVGYSDHTLGVEVPVAAVALGAKIIEKHFTLDTQMAGPDHIASLNPDELTRMTSSIRKIECAMGDGVKRPNESEKIISQVILKRIVAAMEIHKGELLSHVNLCVKRNDKGLSSLEWDNVVGTVAIKDYKTDQPIEL